MKLQPALHDLARPGPPEVEGVSVDARLAAQAPVRTAVVPLSGAAPARGAGGELVERLGPRGPSTPILSHRHDTLRLIGKRTVRLVKIDRISVRIVRPYVGSTRVGKCIASRYTQRNIAP
ncbi:hypothetical protein H8A97_19595 [Bradyrhizobium sp. Arg62]|uniref:hypothetical protein n=1 Tax=Bradyrhizobium TaxID=374 RepID=UPI001E303A2A|nr:MULTISPECIES: hypothetical protein [Bradyrhizobium]MCC8935712.1 hypothetical protein [Bradyrhizobium ivorense]MCC8947260.1 hypothetical protein [Bradyrhizobium brasilense]